MTIQQQYRFFLQQLQIIYSLNEAMTITDWVFESMAAIKRSEIVLNPAQVIPHTLEIKLKDALIALLRHKPIQYVTGEAWFYNLKFKVNKNVLIPRPETEELVQLVIESAKTNKPSGSSILDIGTGSGCIAIALKNKLPTASITAIDISKFALDIAMENAHTHKTSIQFLEIDFLDKTQWELLPSFDSIISNPPYIPLNELEKLEKNVVDYEPHQALFVPNNSPLLFYKNIASFAANHLNPGGKIFMETHEALAKDTRDLFVQNFKDAVIKKDIFGKERMVVATIY